MAFVYKYLTEEDIEKLGVSKALDELSVKFDNVWEVEFTRRPIPWIIDKDRDIAFTSVARIRADSWESNCQGFTLEEIWFLYYKNIAYEIRLFKEDEQYRFRTKEPYEQEMYSVVWKLLSIEPIPKDLELVKNIIHEALKVYGDEGSNPSTDEYLKELTVVLKD